jgi:hypothetical protein
MLAAEKEGVGGMGGNARRGTETGAGAGAEGPVETTIFGGFGLGALDVGLVGFLTVGSVTGLGFETFFSFCEGVGSEWIRGGVLGTSESGSGRAAILAQTAGVNSKDSGMTGVKTRAGTLDVEGSGSEGSTSGRKSELLDFLDTWRVFLETGSLGLVLAKGHDSRWWRKRFLLCWTVCPQSGQEKDSRLLTILTSFSESEEESLLEELEEELEIRTVSFLRESRPLSVAIVSEQKAPKYNSKV